MRGLWTAAALALVTMTAAVPARACLTEAELDVEDVQYADVVVVGRIADYRLVLDPRARRDHQRSLADSPGMSPETRRQMERVEGFITDYARFTIAVDEVLAGEAGASFEATWDNSTFAEPESMRPGPFLIALRDPGSRLPPLRGPSAYIPPSPDPRSLTLLQAPCAPPFLLESESEEADAVRRILKARGPARGGRGLSTPVLAFVAIGAAGALLLVVAMLRRRRRSRG